MSCVKGYDELPTHPYSRMVVDKRRVYSTALQRFLQCVLHDVSFVGRCIPALLLPIPLVLLFLILPVGSTLVAIPRYGQVTSAAHRLRSQGSPKRSMRPPRVQVNHRVDNRDYGLTRKRLW